MFEIYEGVLSKPVKVVLYAVEGLGKSTFASHFPNPLYIDTEGSTTYLNVRRLENPSSWTMLMEEVDYVIANPSLCSTLVIDTIDWAERLCIQHICAVNKWNGIENAGYGKGYTYLMEEMGRFLDKLSIANDRGLNIVVLAHAYMRTITLPEETGSYERWELKMQKKTCPMVKEWADMLLFANYKTMLIKDEKSGKNKGHGGKRVMYTCHTSNWDAKNRFGLKEELPFDYGEIAHLFAPVQPVKPKPVPMADKPTPPPEEIVMSVPVDNKPVESKPAEDDDAWAKDPAKMEALSKLLDLMKQDGITNAQIEKAVSANFEVYPKGTPIRSYDTEFINGMLIGEWKTVKEIIAEMEDVPF